MSVRPISSVWKWRHRTAEIRGSRRLVFPTVLVSLVLGGVSAGLGCASDTTGPAPVDPAHLYYQLALNHHAITLALTPPYDTLQLVATPYAATGVPLPDSGGTTWSTSDTSVQVSSTGLLTAVAPVSGVTVIACHRIGTVTNCVPAMVNVNAVTPVPHVASLTLQPNFISFGINFYDLIGRLQFIPSAVDSQGDTIPNIVFLETSMTPGVLMAENTPPLWWNGGVGSYFDRGPTSPGHAVILAEATVYGVRLVDTLHFTVGWWQHLVVDVLPRTSAGSRTLIGVFTPAEDTIAVNGTMIWRNDLPGQQVDVVFDDSTAVQVADSASFLDGNALFVHLVIPTQGGGNIPAFAPLDTGALRGRDTLGVRARRFPVAGTYRYHSARYGTSGIIHVLPEFQVP